MLLQQVRELLDEFAAQRQSSFLNSTQAKNPHDHALTSRLSQARTPMERVLHGEARTPMERVLHGEARTPMEKLLHGEARMPMEKLLHGVQSKDAVEGGRSIFQERGVQSKDAVGGGRGFWESQWPPIYGCVNGWENERDTVSEYYWHMSYDLEGDECVGYVQRNYPSANGATWGSNGCFAEFGQTRTYYNDNYKNCLFDTSDYREIASRIQSQGAHTCVHGYEVGHLSESDYSEVATDLSTLDECISRVKSVCNSCQGASFNYARGICYEERVSGTAGSPWQGSYFVPPSTSETTTFLHQGCTFPLKKPKGDKCRCKSRQVCYGLECEGGVCFSRRQLTNGVFIGQCTDGDPLAGNQANSYDYGGLDVSFIMNTNA